ncbi:hypothetical protein ACF09I_34480 [Streptomyces sp. NPDC014940]|uniref:hypothetical protein n=1 Tax=Streptomyces sp. NPDC014940 TaxID=3364932 RepID=UPI003701CA59
MGAQTGADERRIRDLLVRMGVGTDAGPATVTAAEPEPSTESSQPDAWWDELYADEEQPAPEQQRRPAPRLPHWWEKKPEQLPEPGTEQAADAPADTRSASPDSNPEPVPAPDEQPQQRPDMVRHASRRQSLLDAWDGIRPRTRWLVHHATAAAAGWPLGLVHWASDTAAWYAAGNWTAPSAWVLYGLGLCSLALYRRARTWVWPAAWAAAVPVSSVIAGVLLYAPAQ